MEISETYGHFHSKMNLENTILSKGNEVKPYVDLMFKGKDDLEMKQLLDKTILLCRSSNSCVKILIEILKKVFIGYHI